MRKFAEAKAASSSAAQTREAAQNAVRRVPVKNRTKLVEPTDYEALLAKNKTQIQSDPYRDLLRFPDDDVSIAEVARKTRQVVPGVPELIREDASVCLMVKECLKTYQENYRTVVFKYSAFSSAYSTLPRVSLPTLQELVFEVDRDEAADKDEDDAQRATTAHAVVQKRGFLFVCQDGRQQDSATSSLNFTKAFKRRYVCLKQQTDLCYVLEYFKDEKRTESKGSIFLDSALDALKSGRQVKGKVCFEITMENKSIRLLAAETEDDAAGWVSALRRAIQQQQAGSVAFPSDADSVSAPNGSALAQPQGKRRLNDNDAGTGTTRLPNSASLEFSFNNELMRCTKETDAVLAFKRREGRHRLFKLHPDVHRQIGGGVKGGTPSSDVATPPVTNGSAVAPSSLALQSRSTNVKTVDDVDSQLCERQIGKQLLLSCIDFRTKLQVSSIEFGKSGYSDNPEPFFITLALYDLRDGRKLSEDAYFTPNSVDVQQMVPTDVLLLRDGPSSRRPISTTGSLSTCHVELVAKTLASVNVDARNLAGARRFLFNVTRPHGDIFLVARVEKVLSGSLSNAVDTYSKPVSGSSSASANNEALRAAAKQHRAMRSTCAHLGHQRMPLAWGARPLFRSQFAPSQTGTGTWSQLKDAVFSADGSTSSQSGNASSGNSLSNANTTAELDAGEFEVTLYRCEHSKLSEEDLFKYLQELRRLDRASKWQTMQANLRLRVEPVVAGGPALLNSLTSSLVPLEPFDRPSPTDSNSTPTASTPSTPTAAASASVSPTAGSKATPPSVPPPPPPTSASNASSPDVIREVEEFLLDAEGNERNAMPYGSFKNLLYVYPRHLNYANQNHFQRARNLCCVVELRDSDELDSVPLRVVYARPPFSIANVFGTQARTVVTHHNTSPDFYDELKFALPANLHAKHHLLFSFYHVTCELSKADRADPQRNVEAPVGHSWLPLFAARRLAVGEISLPIASQLPRGYLEYDVGLSTGSGTISSNSSRPHSGSGGAERDGVRWIDNGKPLFRLNLRLVSTVFTKEAQVQKFFQTCERIASNTAAGASSSTSSNNSAKTAISTSSTLSAIASGSTLQDADMNSLKGVLAADLCTLIHFAPTLFNQLFGLLIVAAEQHEEAVVNIARVLVQLVALLGDAKADKSEVLRWYLRYALCRKLSAQYANATASGQTTATMRTVHEELLRALLGVLKSASADTITIDRMLQHFWFYVEAMRQSAACFLLLTGRIKMLRTERFPPSFYTKLEQLMQTVLPLIVQKSKEQPAISRTANCGLADLVKTCFALADRGFAFKLLSLYLENFPLNDDRSLQEQRFEFLRSVCAYEHFVPLNLPLLQNKNLKEFRRNFVLSSDFVKDHFLAGTLLHELKEAMSEPKPVRKLAINTLRGMLAKHTFDDRYEAKEKQARVVALYLPLVSIVLECRQRFRMPNLTVGRSDALTRSVDADQISVAESQRASGFISENTSVSGLSLSSNSTVVVHQASPGATLTGNYQRLFSRKKLSTGNINSLLPSSNGGDSADGSSTNAGRFSIGSRDVTKVVDTSILDRIAGVGQGQVLSNLRDKQQADQSELASLASHLSTGSDSTLNANEDLDSVIDKRLTLTAGNGNGLQPDIFGASGADAVSQSSQQVSGSAVTLSQLINSSQQLANSVLEQHETRELLGCFVYVLSAVADDVLLSWFRNATESETLSLFDVLRLAVHHFMYLGRKRIVNLALISGARPPATVGTTRGRAMISGIRGSVRPGRDESESTGTLARCPEEASSPDGERSILSGKSAGNAPDNEAVFRSILEANMSAEIGLIVLDVVCLYATNFKSDIERASSASAHEPSALFSKLFEILLCFLHTNQSENTLKHAFPALRSFIQKFAGTLFHIDSLTEKLCYELLRCCNSRLSSTRMSACFLLYWTMRISYETLGRSGFNRILLQITVSVSTLVAHHVLVNNSRFRDSLSMINSHALNDLTMLSTALPHEVKELTKSIRTILMATAQMRECANDPEQFIDLQYALARSYSRSCPALRKTWLDSMAQQHANYVNHAEAALCYVHIAALLNEVLRCKRNRQQQTTLRNLAQKSSPFSVLTGAARDAEAAEASAAKYYIDVDMSVFKKISPNVAGEEVCLSGSGPASVASDSPVGLRSAPVFPTGNTGNTSTSGVTVAGLLNSGIGAALDDVTFSEFDLVCTLEQAARHFQQAERYEAVIEIQKILIIYYERRRDYDELARIYSTMHQNCTTLAALAKGNANRRLLGTYFRVAFFGTIFDQDDTREYIYKEPKITSLAEIYERLQAQFGRRFGRQAIKVLTDSHRINSTELNPQIGYIQVTHVTPYFNIQAQQVTTTAPPNGNAASKRPSSTASTASSLNLSTSSNNPILERAKSLVQPINISDYEYHTNIDCFMFESPFVLNQPTKAHGSVEEQCKRRTILTTANYFPFIKKRIPITQSTEVELTPIEVAIDELAKQVRQLKEILAQTPHDIKKLQLKLQGSVNVQVNAGPIAYAEAFLHPDKVWLYQLQREKVDMLKFVFQQFVETCQEALDLNRSMITPEQWDYHEVLKNSFEDLVRRLNDILKEPILRPVSSVSNLSDSSGVTSVSASSGSSTTVQSINSSHFGLNTEHFQDVDV